jgi:hypothetical protein
VYLSVDSGRPRRVGLVEPNDFTSFKVVAAARSWGELRRALDKASDPDWAAGLDAMVEYAGCKGWLEGSSALRAQCEWPLGEPGTG